MTPELFQNGAKSDPKATPESNQKKNCQSAPKVRQKGAKKDPKKEPQNQKNSFRVVYFHFKKKLFVEAVFSFFLNPPGDPRS